MWRYVARTCKRSFNTRSAWLNEAAGQDRVPLASVEDVRAQIGEICSKFQAEGSDTSFSDYKAKFLVINAASKQFNCPIPSTDLGSIKSTDDLSQHIWNKTVAMNTPPPPTPELPSNLSVERPAPKRKRNMFGKMPLSGKVTDTPVKADT